MSDWFAGKPRLWLGLSIGACAALLLLFAILSYSASRTKSATYDEPLHALAGFIHRTAADFRINPEDPALFGYFSSLPHGRNALKINYGSYYWQRMPAAFNVSQWPFVYSTLYRTIGNDGPQFVQTSRTVFVLVGVALGALIAWWSWQIAGAAAAVIATALFALDPNFMAHTPLVKNDVMLSLCMLGLAMSVWQFGRRGTWPWLGGIALSTAAAVNVKFSGVLCGPIILIALTIRALLPQPWVVVGRTLKTRSMRMQAVVGVCFVAGFAGFVAIWGCYGFRFAPTPSGEVLHMDYLLTLNRVNHIKTSDLPRGTMITPEMIRAQPAGFIADAIADAEANRLLPQAWLYGFLYTHATTLIRSSFLLGEVGVTGWWYYFPCTMLFKTPTATLAAMLLAAAVAALTVLYTITQAGPFRAGYPGLKARLAAIPLDWWTVVCLSIPPALYAISAMSTNLNLGLRHILPVYPFIFIAVAVGFVRLMQRWKRTGRIVAAIVVVGLAAESLPAWPDFVPFFNAPTKSWRDPLDVLGDSNLDWGQDLKALAKWQEDHKDRPLYLAYFGVGDPWAHGVNAIHLPPQAGGWPFANETQMPQGRCYFAVSATNLQGIYVAPEIEMHWYRPLRKRTPIAVLGKTIYIYEWPRSESTPAGQSSP